MRKRLFALLAIIILAVSCLSVLPVADTGISEGNAGVITTDLQTVMNSATSTQLIPVCIWTTEIDSDEVEQLAYEEAGINRDIIRDMVDQGRIEEITLEDVDAYIDAERRIYAELQLLEQQEFTAQYSFLQTAVTRENAYVCSYAPMICVELTSAQIQTLAGNADVNTIYYSPEVEVVDEMNISLPTVSADYVRDEAFSGDGIKIGMVEGGMPLATAEIPFTNDDGVNQVILDPNSAYRTEHATAVAEIMLSNGTLKGIVPDATLYCSSIVSVGMFSAIEWLLSNNVHVINMSAEFYDEDRVYGEYTVYERWADHIAHNHSVHFVKSAGNYHGINNPNLRVTHPGLAYNVITVGAIDDKNTSNLTDDEIAYYSCYNESYDTSDTDYIIPPNKPDIVAPGENITTSSGTVSGTSFSAPHVTGVVAQLIQQYPALATLQDLMKAILTAAVSHDTLQFETTNTLYSKYGAGVVNAAACTEISYRGTFGSSSFSSTEANICKTYTFEVTSADTEIRVSLAWLRSVWFSSSSSHFTTSTPETCASIADLDLAIITPDGTELLKNGMANDDDNTNVVIIQFDPQTYGTGTYTVEVWIRASTGKKTYFGLAWWADRE